jgi:hypothetical protein
LHHGEQSDFLSCLLAATQNAAGGTGASVERQQTALLIPQFVDDKRGQAVEAGRQQSLDSISIGQWIAANARIMQALVEAGQLGVGGRKSSARS